jgi:hypothetical protein
MDPAYREKVILALSEKGRTEESKQRAAEKLRKLWEDRKSSGWSMPEETRQKFRDKVFTEETRKKMSIAAKNRQMTDETKDKISKATKGTKRGPYGDSRKTAMGAGVKAAWQDPEKRLNMMEARKRAWETRRANMNKDKT